MNLRHLARIWRAIGFCARGRCCLSRRGRLRGVRRPARRRAGAKNRPLVAPFRLGELILVAHCAAVGLCRWRCWGFADRKIVSATVFAKSIAFEMF
jgi:hypothetical protein